MTTYKTVQFTRGSEKEKKTINEVISHEERALSREREQKEAKDDDNDKRNRKGPLRNSGEIRGA